MFPSTWFILLTCWRLHVLHFFAPPPPLPFDPHPFLLLHSRDRIRLPCLDTPHVSQTVLNFHARGIVTLIGQLHSIFPWLGKRRQRRPKSTRQGSSQEATGCRQPQWRELWSALRSAHWAVSALHWLVEVLLYVHRKGRFIRDGSPGRPPRLSHSSWAPSISILALKRTPHPPPPNKHTHNNNKKQKLNWNKTAKTTG